MVIIVINLSQVSLILIIICVSVSVNISLRLNFRVGLAGSLRLSFNESCHFLELISVELGKELCNGVKFLILAFNFGLSISLGEENVSFLRVGFGHHCTNQVLKGVPVIITDLSEELGDFVEHFVVINLRIDFGVNF